MSRPTTGGGHVGGLVLIASTVLSGAMNYGYTVLMLHLLPATAFSHFALVNSLLLLVGTCASVSIPWVLAREVAQTRVGSARRRRAVRFSLVSSLFAGGAAAGGACLLAARYADAGLLAAATVACVAIFLNAVGMGYLQGSQRFAGIGILQVTEVLARVVAGVGLVLLLRSESAAVAGTAAGAGLTLTVGLWLMRRDLWSGSGADDGAAAPRVALGAEAVRLTAVQAFVSVLQTVDVIIIGLLVASSRDAAGYQAMLVLARTPAYLGAPLGAVTFAKLVSDHTSRRAGRRAVHDAVRTFVVLGGLVAAVVITLPDDVLHVLVPPAYAPYHRLLLPLTVAAFLSGLTALCAAALQAARRYRTTIVTLVLAIAGTAVALALRVPHFPGLAWTLCGGLGAAVLLLGVQVSRAWAGVRWPVTTAVLPLTAWIMLTVTHGRVALWAVTAVVLGLLTMGWFVLGGRPAGPQARHRAGRVPAPPHVPIDVPADVRSNVPIDRYGDVEATRARGFPHTRVRPEPRSQPAGRVDDDPWATARDPDNPAPRALDTVPIPVVLPLGMGVLTPSARRRPAGPRRPGHPPMTASAEPPEPAEQQMIFLEVP